VRLPGMPGDAPQRDQAGYAPSAYSGHRMEPGIRFDGAST
jgi:hypothetical protein